MPSTSDATAPGPGLQSLPHNVPKLELDDPARVNPGLHGGASVSAVSARGAGPIRVFLLDDHEMIRRGIVGLLSEESGIAVVGEAGTAAEARRRIPAAQPHVALLDGRLPDGSGMEVCRDLTSTAPQIRCLILTSYDDDAVFAAVMAGAAGYLLKDVTGRLLTRLREGKPQDARLAPLTGRERQVLAHIADGLTNREMGAELNLSEKTVKNYVSGLFAKLGMQRRSQAAVYGADIRRT